MTHLSKITHLFRPHQPTKLVSFLDVLIGKKIGWLPKSKTNMASPIATTVLLMQLKSLIIFNVLDQLWGKPIWAPKIRLMLSVPSDQRFHRPIDLLTLVPESGAQFIKTVYPPSENHNNSIEIYICCNCLDYLKLMQSESALAGVESFSSCMIGW